MAAQPQVSALGSLVSAQRNNRNEIGKSRDGLREGGGGLG
jgi:hypothetical protein